MGIKIKKTEFHADFESVKKVLKKCKKKLLAKKREILRFLAPFSDFFRKKNFKVILVLFSNFEDKRTKNGSKKQNKKSI